MASRYIKEQQKGQIDLLLLWRVLQGNIIKIGIVAVLLAAAVGLFRYTNSSPFYRTDSKFLVSGVQINYTDKTYSEIQSAISSANLAAMGANIAYNTPYILNEDKALNNICDYLKTNYGDNYARISRKEADYFIQMYFARYPGVRAFMDECVEKGRATGYAETLFGRRRELFELSSSNRNVRSFGERAAMNTPVQGTAADIIKLAMVRVSERLAQSGFKARLILQVHDELVVECPLAEADEVSALLQQTMESVIQLKVPLVAEVSRGKDWESAH